MGYSPIWLQKMGQFGHTLHCYCESWLGLSLMNPGNFPTTRFLPNPRVAFSIKISHYSLTPSLSPLDHPIFSCSHLLSPLICCHLCPKFIQELSSNYTFQCNSYFFLKNLPILVLYIVVWLIFALCLMSIYDWVYVVFFFFFLSLGYLTHASFFFSFWFHPILFFCKFHDTLAFTPG